MTGSLEDTKEMLEIVKAISTHSDRVSRHERRQHTLDDLREGRIIGRGADQ